MSCDLTKEHITRYFMVLKIVVLGRH